MRRNLDFKTKKPHLVILKGIKYNYTWKNLLVIRSKEYGRLTNKEIESARRAIRRGIKKTGELYIRAYGYLPVLKKPAEVRMGKGKGGKIRYKIYPVRPGQILFQLKNVPFTIGFGALNAGLKKLSVKSYIGKK